MRAPASFAVSGVRARVLRRMEKELRRAGHHHPRLRRLAGSHLRQRASLEDALGRVMTDESLNQFDRGMAARILAVGKPRAALERLFAQFWTQQEQWPLYETGLAIEMTQDLRALRPLIGALHDTNPYRQAAAARAMGWLRWGSNRAARELSRIVADPSQPAAVRAEAAEPLAYQYANRAIPALLEALRDPDPQLRYWAVFALGSVSHKHSERQRDPRVVPALESMLPDDAVPPAQWNSVGQEALAVLANPLHAQPKYAELYEQELERIRQDPDAPERLRKWAGCD